MSIAFLKRSLTLLNLAAILILAAAAYGYWEHNDFRRNGGPEVDWRPEVEPIGATAPPIDEVGIRLGRFKKQEAPVPTAPVEQPKDEIEKVLANVGEITNAVVRYPPYSEGARPSITFKKKDGTILTLAVGEAIVNDPHPVYGDLQPIPRRYMFLRCEPDPEHPGWTFFVFDMNCDATDIQKARWILEQEGGQAPERGAEGPAEAPPEVISTKHALVGRPGAVAVAPAPSPEPETAPQPVPQPEPAVEAGDFSGPIFGEEEGGILVASRASVEYLRQNQDALIKDAMTRTYVDPRTRRPAGIRITAIRPGSRANEFGIRPDDVILSINDTPVTSQDQAVNVVREELRRPNNYILRVKILRDGRELTQRYDTRDRETRKAAESFRGRR